jgi:hypothetical protein
MAWETLAEEAGLAEDLQPSASAVLWQPQLDWLAGRPPIGRTLPAQSVKTQAEEVDGRTQRLVSAEKRKVVWKRCRD